MHRFPLGMNPELTFEQNREDLRGLVAKSRDIFKLSWADLAVEANLNFLTVQRFGDGMTQQPRYSTILALQRVFARYENRYHQYLRTLPVETTVVVETAAEPRRERTRRRTVKPEPAWRQRPVSRRLARRRAHKV